MSGTPPMPPDDPAPAPEGPRASLSFVPWWAVKMITDLGKRGTSDPLADVARLLATLRERTLREAAGVCFDRAIALNAAADHARATMGDDCPRWSRDSENEAGRNGHAILSLIAQPPKEA